MATIRHPRTARAAAALAATGLVLAGCGTVTTSMSATGADHDRADVAFATRMIPHHEMAVHMAEMAQWHGASPELADLAGRIEHAQEGEIDQMAGWLESWDEDAGGWHPMMGGGSMMDDDDRGYGPGMMGDRWGDRSGDRDGYGPWSGPGMMGGRWYGFGMMGGRLHGRDGARARTFEDGWLRMMIAHHRVAIRMARTELADGEYPPALDLARGIITAQQAEIDRMQEMLAD